MLRNTNQMKAFAKGILIVMASLFVLVSCRTSQEVSRNIITSDSAWSQLYLPGRAESEPITNYGIHLKNETKHEISIMAFWIKKDGWVRLSDFILDSRSYSASTPAQINANDQKNAIFSLSSQNTAFQELPLKNFDGDLLVEIQWKGKLHYVNPGELKVLPPKRGF